jgi:hypothetical protein
LAPPTGFGPRSEEAYSSHGHVSGRLSTEPVLKRPRVFTRAWFVRFCEALERSESKKSRKILLSSIVCKISPSFYTASTPSGRPEPFWERQDCIDTGCHAVSALSALRPNATSILRVPLCLLYVDSGRPVNVGTGSPVRRRQPLRLSRRVLNPGVIDPMIVATLRRRLSAQGALGTSPAMLRRSPRRREATPAQALGLF